MKKIVSLLLTGLMLCTVISAMTFSTFAKEKAGDNQSNSGSAFTASIDDSSKGGSSLSEGDLTIIVGVSAAVVFGFGSFFLGKAVGKKKQSVIAEGIEKESEE